MLKYYKPLQFPTFIFIGVYFTLHGVQLSHIKCRSYPNISKLHEKNMFFILEKTAKIDGNLKFSTQILIKRECKIMYAHLHGRCIYISLYFYHFP